MLQNYSFCLYLTKKYIKNLFVYKKTRTFAADFEQFEHWRDGRVVDYNGHENRRAERHRGFESLSLRKAKAQSFGKQMIALIFVYMNFGRVIRHVHQIL